MQSNVVLSRAGVSTLLSKHPKSPCWINNARLANFCRLKDDGSMHNSAILGKYLPRGKVFWERCLGLAYKTCVNRCERCHALVVLCCLLISYHFLSFVYIFDDKICV